MIKLTIDGQPVEVEKGTTVLLAAEKFATIAYILGNIPYPGEQIHDAWLKLLEAMDHNNAGTGAENTRKLKKEYKRYASGVAVRIIRDSVRSIAENVEVKDNAAIPIVVFNPLSWRREDIAVDGRWHLRCT